MNKTLLLSILFIFVATVKTFSQVSSWTKNCKWTLYEIRDDNAFSYSLDTLKNFKSHLLDDSIIRSLTKTLDQWPPEKTSMWMGLYVVTCKTPDGIVKKIDVSVYGGFFFDEQTKTYWAVADNEKERWVNYFHDEMSKF